MFDDEDPFTFKKMHEFSTVDGFVEVGECLADMMKYVANEPSVGLYYIQQHVQNSAPNLINLKNKVGEKSREMTLHTEDSEDSISMVRSMRECGYVIADDMIKDITSSLAIMATKQPKKGLITCSNSSFKIGRNTSSWSPSVWGRSSSSSQQDDVGTSNSYLSNVMRSTKLSNFRWPQLEPKEPGQDKGAADGNTSSDTQDAERDELPLSSHILDELKVLQTEQSLSKDEVLSLAENYDEFKADREAKLQKWLAEAGLREDKQQEIAKDLGRLDHT